MQTDIETMPLFDLSSVVEEINIKTREASQNTDLDMREFLGIDKALQSINGELHNNTAKHSELDKRIKRDTVYKTSKKCDKQGSNFCHKTVGIFKHN